VQPDYTISIWPAEFEKDEAEKCEALGHIHFDAKYQVEGRADGVTYAVLTEGAISGA